MSHRLITVKEGIMLALPYSELVEVSLALQEESQDRIMNKEDFTRLVLKDSSDRKHIVKCEKGKPYQGIYHLLHQITKPLIKRLCYLTIVFNHHLDKQSDGKNDNHSACNPVQDFNIFLLDAVS